MLTPEVNSRIAWLAAHWVAGEFDMDGLDRYLAETRSLIKRQTQGPQNLESWPNQWPNLGHNLGTVGDRQSESQQQQDLQ